MKFSYTKTMHFSENLKEAMFCKNITTKALADATGISVDTINCYLKTKGSLPKIDKAVKLAHALDVSAEFLAEGFETGSTRTARTMQMNAENITLLQKLACLSAKERRAVISLVDAMAEKYPH